MPFNLRISDEVDDKITIIAKLEQRSKNKQIEHILEEYIKKYETINGKIDIEKYRK